MDEPPLIQLNEQTNKQTFIHASPTVPCLVTTGRGPLGTQRTLEGYRFHTKPLAKRLFRIKLVKNYQIL